MSALQADLREAANCDANYQSNPQASDCQNLQYLAERVAENRRDLPKPLFEQLVVRDAPIIDVTYSTYGYDTYVFDPATRKLHKIYYSGC